MQNPEAVAWLEEQIQYGEPGPAEGFGIPAAFIEGLEAAAERLEAADPIEGHGTGEVRGLIATMESQPDAPPVSREPFRYMRRMLLQDFTLDLLSEE